MCHTLAHAPVIFGGMVTYYCISLEEALRRAKIAGKQPGCYYGGITLRSGKKGFAVYREGKVVEQYSVLNKNAHRNGERKDKNTYFLSILLGQGDLAIQTMLNLQNKDQELYEYKLDLYMASHEV